MVLRLLLLLLLCCCHQSHNGKEQIMIMPKTIRHDNLYAENYLS